MTPVNVTIQPVKNNTIRPLVQHVQQSDIRVHQAITTTDDKVNTAINNLNNVINALVQQGIITL